MNKIRECLRLARWLSNDLLGDLEESERESLDAWLAASPEHPAKYETLRTSVIKKDLSEDRMAIAKVAWHEFDRKNIKRLKKPLFLRYVAVAAILCFIGAGILYYFRDVPEIVAERILPGEAKAILELSDGRTYDLTEDGGIKNVIAENIVADSCGLEYLRKKDTISSNVMSYHKLTIPRGGIFHLFLEDGTEIWLNSESKLVYPEAFTGKTREVYLEGEAYFDVAEDAACPFIVHSGGLYAKVLGTSFGVTNYTEENTMSLTLVSGKVQTEFPAISDEVYFLEPGYQIFYDQERGKIEKRLVNVDEYVAWKDGMYVFDQTPLGDILQTLSRWYDFQMFYQNASIKETSFSGELMRFESFEDILDIISKASDVQFSINGRTVIASER